MKRKKKRPRPSVTVTEADLTESVRERLELMYPDVKDGKTKCVFCTIKTSKESGKEQDVYLEGSEPLQILNHVTNRKHPRPFVLLECARLG